MVAALTRLIMSSGKSVAGFTELLLLKMNSPFLHTTAEVASVSMDPCAVLSFWAARVE